MKSLAFALLLMIAACTNGGDPLRSTDSAPRETGADVRVPLLASGGASHQVGAIGTLEVDGPCLYLRASNGSRTLPLFATARTRWNRAEGLLEVGDKKFTPGQTVILGGSPLDSVPSGVDWVQAPDPACKAPRAFIAYTIDAR